MRIAKYFVSVDGTLERVCPNGGTFVSGCDSIAMISARNRDWCCENVKMYLTIVHMKGGGRGVWDCLRDALILPIK